MSRVSIRSQIAALKADLDGTVFPSMQQRELHRQHLAAALRTLRWVEANETQLRALQGRLPNASGGRP